MLKNIVIIGSGNLATQLARVLNNNGFAIKQIYSRHIKNAKLLADKYSTIYINTLKELISNADIYIIAVADNAIEQVVNEIEDKNFFVVHTSGSVGMEVLYKFNNYGVIYPLQTFSKNKIPKFKDIPFLIESNSNENDNRIKHFVSCIGSEIILNVTSEQRKHIHLAAVFACNFTNYMYNIAHRILQKNDIPFTIFHPLIKETADKVIKSLPLQVQTGPAVRKDYSVLEKHNAMLIQYPMYKEIYNIISRSIIEERWIKNDL